MEHIGFILLHPKELANLDEIKQKVTEAHGNVVFDLQNSQSSGEVFTQFKELHYYKANGGKS